MNTTKKVYVTMTDKFMSGWGRAENKINKYVIECDNWEQAEIIKRNAKTRPEMKYINLVSKKPNYNKERYVTSLSRFEDLGAIWTEEPKI